MLPRAVGIRLYFPVVGLAALVGMVTFVRLARRERWPVADAVRFQVVLVCGALLGAYLYSMVERGIIASALAGDPGGLLHPGLRYPGGLLGALLIAPLARRFRPAAIGWLATADLAAPATGFAMALVRFGCLLQGCCFGSPTDLPWGIRFPRDSPAWFAQHVDGRVGIDAAWSLPVHPLQVYFALVALGAGLIALRVLRRHARAGSAALTFLALHETGRALLEPLRVPPIPALQIISVALGGVGLVGLLVRRMRTAVPSSSRVSAAMSTQRTTRV